MLKVNEINCFSGFKHDFCGVNAIEEYDTLTAILCSIGLRMNVNWS
jgi:hypothetical protein